ncbi:MAG: c-type cytochrome [Alphaproteobacteria bacterium]|nr:c-type cytochrome [Alphaproteobacteria bacterium]
MTGTIRKTALLVPVIAGILIGGPVWAQSEGPIRGEAVYQKRCLMCHGEEGDGLGPAAERLNPPPRDFTLGQFKIKTTAFKDPITNDADLIRMIGDGMPGTAMPGWSDILSEQEISDVIHYIKTFAELEEEKPSDQIDYGTQVKSSPESIATGKKIFHDGDRCSECHGAEGLGDAVKKLKNDNGERTWPRNLTKPWTYRASNDAKDIFARVTAGIPTTQMPSFTNPKSKKKLSIEDRWHVANYAASLADAGKKVRAENTVIKAVRVEGDVPTSPDDPAWQQSTSSTFFLVPQIIAKPRFFKSANDSVSVRALYNDKRLSVLIEWDDRTKSIPGDEVAIKIADKGMSPDAIAVQFPVEIPAGMEKPYFLMGSDAKPVNLWRWSSGTTEKPESVALIDAAGITNQQPRDAATSGLSAKGAYKDGTWRVAMTRLLTTSETAKDIQFAPGRFIPIAFFNWDGSNSEQGTKHTLTTWYWLLLQPEAGSKPLMAAIIVALLIGGALVWWGRSASAANKETDL